MYVAITRARQRLYLSFCQSRMLHGKTRYGVMSRFIEELPADAVKWLIPRAPRFGIHDSTERPAGAAAAPQGLLPAQQQRAGWRVGQSVFHAKFGEGVIRQLRGEGDAAQARIDFARRGEVDLMLAMARLTPIDE